MLDTHTIVRDHSGIDDPPAPRRMIVPSPLAHPIVRPTHHRMADWSAPICWFPVAPVPLRPLSIARLRRTRDMHGKNDSPVMCWYARQITSKPLHCKQQPAAWAELKVAITPARRITRWPRQGEHQRWQSENKDLTRTHHLSSPSPRANQEHRPAPMLRPLIGAIWIVSSLLFIFLLRLDSLHCLSCLLCHKLA